MLLGLRRRGMVLKEADVEEDGAERVPLCAERVSDEAFGVGGDSTELTAHVAGPFAATKHDVLFGVETDAETARTVLAYLTLRPYLEPLRKHSFVARDKIERVVDRPNVWQIALRLTVPDIDALELRESDHAAVRLRDQVEAERELYLAPADSAVRASGIRAVVAMCGSAEKAGYFLTVQPWCWASFATSLLESLWNVDKAKLQNRPGWPPAHCSLPG